MKNIHRRLQTPRRARYGRKEATTEGKRTRRGGKNELKEREGGGRRGRKEESSFNSRLRCARIRALNKCNDINQTAFRDDKYTPTGVPSPHRASMLPYR